MGILGTIAKALAPELAGSAIEKGGGWLRDKGLGDPEVRELRTALDEALRRAIAALPLDDDDLIRDHLHSVLTVLFKDQPLVEALLGAALQGAAARDVTALATFHARLHAIGADLTTIHVDAETLFRTLIHELADALLRRAVRADNPLYNHVSLAQLALMRDELSRRELQFDALLERFAHFEKLLQELRAVLADTLSIAEQQRRLTAQLNAAQPAQQAMLAEVVATLHHRGEAAQRAWSINDLFGMVVGEGRADGSPPPFNFVPFYEKHLSEQAVERLYLEAVVQNNATLILPLADQQSSVVPLERIYVALKAVKKSQAEQNAEQTQISEAFERGQGVRISEILSRQLLPADAIRRREGRGEARNLAELVRDHQWLVLVGDPGSGKSTLARWLALRLARAMQAGDEELVVPADHVRPDPEEAGEERLGPVRLPILIRLADYAQARWGEGGNKALTLADYLGVSPAVALLESQTKEQRLWQRYLTERRATLILDGLDEVTDSDQRRDVKAEIEALIDRWFRDEKQRSPLDNAWVVARQQERPWRGNQLIVTSRIVGYAAAPLAATLPRYEIALMENVAVRRFCQNWVEAHPDLEENAEALAAAVLDHSNHHVKSEMGRNPLMLTILAQIWREAPDRTLPQRRATLYSAAAKQVFDQRRDGWGRLGEQLGNDLADVMQRLTASIAFRLHAHADYIADLVDEETLQEWLVEAIQSEPALQRQPRHPNDLAEEVLEAARQLSGFLVPRGHELYGFLHRQFQEYFAAIQLLGECKATKEWSPIWARIDQPAWYEVLLIAVGLLAGDDRQQLRRNHKGGQFLTALLDHEAADPTGGLLPVRTLFAALALREARGWTDALTQRIASALIAAYSRENAARFEALHEAVEKCFATLPREEPRGGTGVRRALVAALNTTGPDAGRWQRMAAAELIVKYEWWHRDVASALRAAWQRELEPAATLRLALETHWRASPNDFMASEFQQWVTDEWWAQMMAHDHWQGIILALYLMPGAELAREQCLLDSALTPHLWPLLQAQPADRDALTTLLWELWESDDDQLARDAARGLAYLGDERAATRVGNSGNHRARAMIAGFALARALDLDRALDRALDLDLALARARDRALDLDLDRALDRARARALALALDLDRALDRDLARALAHLASIVQVIESAIRAAESRGIDDVEIMEALAHAKRQLTELRPLLLGYERLVTFWQGVAQWPNNATMEAWAAQPRPALTNDRLAWLLQMQEHAAKMLLPRLKVSGALDDAHLAELCGWLRDGREWQQCHAALLLAEMDRLTIVAAEQWLPDCLRSEEDLTRYRAQQALMKRRKASKADEAALRALGAWDNKRENNVLVNTYGGWALKEVEHDDPALLQRWIDDGDDALLQTVHRLSDECWPPWLEGLANGVPSTQKSMLDATSWLLRLNPLPDKAPKIGEQLLELLISLTANDDPAISEAAFTTLGLLRDAGLRSSAIDHLLASAPDKGTLQPARQMALARLAAGADDAQHTAIEDTLREPLPHVGAAAALLRIAWQRRYRKSSYSNSYYLRWDPDIDEQPAIERVNRLRSQLPDSDWLSAMLQAGTDDDYWENDGYHERIVGLIGREIGQLAEAHADSAVRRLLNEITPHDDEAWPRRRIALAALATVAEASPTLFSNVPNVEAMLLRGAADVQSFTARRHAIRAMSQLRRVGPSLLLAILNAAGDIGKVQRDAVAAVANYQRLDRDAFVQQADDPASALHQLRDALHAHSAARAYLAVQMLGTLGRAPAAQGVAGLRARIIGWLSEAYKDEANRQRDVFLLEKEDNWSDEEITHKGTLGQAILAALLGIIDLPF